MRCPLKWVGLAMALLGILVVGSVNYAQLDRNKGVEAARFTIDGKETVRLKIYATLAEGKQIRVTIGQNEITFTWTAENAKDGLDTGYLEISGSEVLVQLLDVGAPNRCQIPVREIPTATWKQFCTGGLQTGDVQVTLRWNSTADLDLHVVDPNGCEVYYRNPTCPSGGKLDVDANADCENVTTRPVENIFWPPGQAPRGEYKVFVHYYARCSGASSTESFTVRVLVDGTEQVFSGTIRVDELKLITTFRR
jgi:hypothetical protein